MRYSLISDDSGEKILSVYLDDGTSLTARDSHPNFEEIFEQVVFDGDDLDLHELFDVGHGIASKLTQVTDRVSYRDNTLYFDNDPLNSSLARQIIRFVHENDPEQYQSLCLFLENVKSNPDPLSEEQLYDWVRHQDIAINTAGEIIAYKGVKGDEIGGWESVHSGRAIVDGKVHHGCIPNKVGSVVEMPRSEVDSNPHASCSVGLHVGSYNYASTWAQGALLTVAVNPRDVISVPSHTDGQKIRVCRYRVLHIAEHEYTHSFFDEPKDEFESLEGEVRDTDGNVSYFSINW